MNADSRLSPEDWAAVNDLFHRALELPVDERDPFLDASCATRPDLRREVATLLVAHDAADDFIERPAAAIAGDDAGPLVSGRVGHYQISRILGIGGMGVVYLAEDTRLGRTVALKALAPQFTFDATRRERLRREARAAAGLNDPAIATVYALEEIDGRVFIASEFVPGETLREELARGPLPPERALETALTIARGLSVAHDRGVVHRDLKPENVVRTPSGAVKILDFGLARMRGELPGAALTGDGDILGTPAYMSPEQIRGEPVDARSDLFAFGVLLYELATGVHPFASRDPAGTIARILEREPAPFSSPPEHVSSDPLPQAMAHVIRICLRKRPEDRYTNAHELLAALRQAATDHSAGRSAAANVAARPGDGAFWWWRFHQVAAALGYLLLLVPLWQARGETADLAGLLAFVAGVTAATTAAVLRLHLWFAASTYPSELGPQRTRARTWLRTADVLYVIVLLLSGLRVVVTDTPAGALLIGSAVAILIAFTIIEPATTRAALDRRERP